jgi:hypothetical protein
MSRFNADMPEQRQTIQEDALEKAITSSNAVAVHPKFIQLT